MPLCDHRLELSHICLHRFLLRPVLSLVARTVAPAGLSLEVCFGHPTLSAKQPHRILCPPPVAFF